MPLVQMMMMAMAVSCVQRFERPERESVKEERDKGSPLLLLHLCMSLPKIKHRHIAKVFFFWLPDLAAASKKKKIMSALALPDRRVAMTNG